MPLNFGQSLHHVIFLPPQIFDKGLYLFIYLFIYSSTKIFQFLEGSLQQNYITADPSPRPPSPIYVLYSFRKALWVIYFTAHRAQLTLSITFLLKESAETWSLVEDKAELYQKVWSRSRNSPFLCFQTLKFMIQNRTICCNFSQSSPVSIVFF